MGSPSWVMTVFLGLYHEVHAGKLQSLMQLQAPEFLMNPFCTTVHNRAFQLQSTPQQCTRENPGKDLAAYNRLHGGFILVMTALMGLDGDMQKPAYRD